jgi:hypothetical protein
MNTTTGNYTNQWIQTAKDASDKRAEENDQAESILFGTDAADIARAERYNDKHFNPRNVKPPAGRKWTFK